MVDISSFFVALFLATLMYNLFKYGVLSLMVPTFFSPMIHGYLILVCSVGVTGGYANHKEFDRLSDLLAAARGANQTILISIVLLFFLQIETSRLLFILFFFMLPLATVLGRVMANSFFEVVLRENFLENTLIYGAGQIGKDFYLIQQKSASNLNVVGFIDDDPGVLGMSNPAPVLGSFGDLKEVATENKVRRLIVAIKDLTRSRVTELEDTAREFGLRVSFVPSPDLYNNPLKLRDFSGVTLAASRSTDSQHFSYEISKRILDLFFAVVLLILSLPIWIAVGILIKLDDGGPIFFAQERVGLKGKLFKIYKFRSMYTSAEKYSFCPTNSTDPRITKVGRWLRRSSLDELPQLINVFKGDMSFVGPRPEMPFIVEKYNEFEIQRLQVIPGITGLWQISEGRKAEITENLEYDLYYIENRCVTLDLTLMVLTGIFVTRGVTH